MISFIIPTHNEESFLSKTMRAIHESARRSNFDYEVVVVNDASTDRTSEIAQAMGARVINVNHRRIAATALPPKNWTQLLGSERTDYELGTEA